MANDYSGKADSHDRTFSFFPKIFPSLLLKRLERFVKLFRFNENPKVEVIAVFRVVQVVVIIRVVGII